MGERVDRGLLEAMQSRATASAGEFNPQAIGEVLWALATMGERADRGLLEAMQSRATATAGEFTPQSALNVLWALAVMGEKSPGILVDHFTATLSDQLTLPERAQLHQWLLACELGLESGASLDSGVARIQQVPTLHPAP